MRESTVTAAGVFVLVTAGTLVAGAIMGQFADALLIGPIVGGFFAVLSFLLARRG
jgi:hypothetical protein